MSLTPRSQAHLRTFWMAYAVLLISLSLTCTAYFGHRQHSLSRDQSRSAQAGAAAFAQSRSNENAFFDSGLPLLLLTLGVAGSFLLFGFVFSQARSRSTAEGLTRELRESETLYQSLVQTLPHCIFRKDLQGNFTFGNAAFCDTFKVQPGTLPGKTDFDFFPGAMARKYQNDDHRVMESGQPLHAIQGYHPAPGQTRFLQVVKTPLRDAQGRIIGVQGVYWDITENKLAESRLAAEKERLAVTLRSISDAVIATDVAGNILLMNPVAEHMTEISQARASGESIEKIFALRDPQSRAVRHTDFYLLLQGKNPDSLKPVLLTAPSGRETLVQKRAAPIRDGDGLATGAVFVFRDVTRERKAEEELLRASKLESVGLLAGGIAHDFNNVLTGIVGNLSLLRETPGLPAEVAERMALLERTAYKARQLTLQLLTFAKGGSPIKQTASLREVIRESAEFALRGSNLRAEFRFPDDLTPVEIDTGQIGQVVQNLVINSKQAMPQGGTIEISAANCLLDGSVNLPLPPGKYARLSIRDTGTGIKPEHLGQIFDPYFSTKSTGTGLGLATAYSILKRHDGLITVESEWDQGSTFHLYLPASPTKLPPSQPEPARPIHGTGRILAMDDDPSIRSLLCAILAHYGYTATAVADGREAIREYQQAAADRDPYAAVIMDLTIPGGMGGKEAIAELLRLDPRVRAIVSSGYSNDPVLAEYRKYGFLARVEKPYRLQELASVLNEMLRREEEPEAVQSGAPTPVAA
jgi:PAS domain S-box-containing protein